MNELTIVHSERDLKKIKGGKLLVGGKGGDSLRICQCARRRLSTTEKNGEKYKGEKKGPRREKGGNHQIFSEETVEGGGNVDTGEKAASMKGGGGGAREGRV